MHVSKKERYIFPLNERRQTKPVTRYKIRNIDHVMATFYLSKIDNLHPNPCHLRMTMNIRADFGSR